MINSTRCPLCPSGIGHAMDEKHAAKVEELLKGCRMALGHLRDDRREPSPITEFLEQVIAKAEGNVGTPRA